MNVGAEVAAGIGSLVVLVLTRLVDKYLPARVGRAGGDDAGAEPGAAGGRQDETPR
ncbi:hypothetical protein AB0O47_39415 [Streptomyces noursei]|uniref:hypothetical protein n=1 Tax=Streptomyces noursei TaxID=1971 RepID=UPI00344CDA89